MARRRCRTSAAGNRLIWDLTYTGPRYPKNAVTWGYTGGVKAPPGDYRVRLVANGVTMEKPFRVIADPRLTVTQADYEGTIPYRDPGA